MTRPAMRHSSAVLRAALVLLGFGLLFNSGCATVGHDFPEDMISKIEMGRTTKDDLLAMFGEPWRTGIEDGLKTWTYAKYRYRLFGSTSTTDLIVRFNAEDVVESYSFNTTEPRLPARK
jgi:hypothetical protein